MNLYKLKTKLKKILDRLKDFYDDNQRSIYLGSICIFLIAFMLVTVNKIYTKQMENYDKYKLPFIYKLKSKYDEAPEFVLEESKYHVSLNISDDGYNVYAPIGSRAGYRYGPSIIINDDGSLDAFFSSPGNYREWDWISYQHSDDGINWSKEKIVLEPTSNSLDHYSVCDPGIVYFNGYYYLGYTSTITSTNNGINNNVFVSRSKSIDGPYEKWNGEGWGGKPKPIIYFNESNSFWGAGEISFVVANDTLYCYYTWDCEHGNSTRVSTAKLTDDWPNTLEYQGIAINQKSGQDSCDVVYLEEYNKFVSFAIEGRFTGYSGIIIYESDDGIDFSRSDDIYSGVSMYAHNMGISKRLDGHIKESDNLCIGYAYSASPNSKGKWATRIQPVELIVYKSSKVEKHDAGGSPVLRSNVSSKAKSAYLAGINVTNKTIKMNVNETSRINVIGYSQDRGTINLSKNPTYSYDESLINIKGNTITALKEGECVVEVKYDDFYTTCTVVIKDENYNYSPKKIEIVKFEPVEEVYKLHIENSNYHTAQIRGYVEFNNTKWGEACNDYTYNHPSYPSMIDASKYPMEFEVEDKSIVDIDDSGIMTPKKVGETNIKVTIADDLSFVVKVIVEF